MPLYPCGARCLTTTGPSATTCAAPVRNGAQSMARIVRCASPLALDLVQSLCSCRECSRAITSETGAFEQFFGPKQRDKIKRHPVNKRPLPRAPVHRANGPPAGSRRPPGRGVLLGRPNDGRLSSAILICSGVAVYCTTRWRRFYRLTEFETLLLRRLDQHRIGTAREVKR